MKKFLAMLLCVCLVVSMMPAVFAAEAETAHVHTEEQSALLQQLLACGADYVAYYGLTPDMPDSVLVDIFFELPDEEFEKAYNDLEILAAKGLSLSLEEQEILFADENVNLCARFYNAINDAWGVSTWAFDDSDYTCVNGVGVMVDGGSSHDETDGVVTVTAKTKVDSSCPTNIKYTTVTATISLYNDSGADGQLVFNYTMSNCNSLTIDGAKVTESGSFSKVVAAGDYIEIVLTSGQNDTLNELVLTNLAVNAIASSSNVTVKYDSSLGTVTSAGETVGSDNAINITDAITLTAAAKSGASFLGWMTENGLILSKTANLKVESIGDQTVQAVFVANNGQAWFEVNNGYMYNDLSVAVANGNKVTLMNNGTLAAGTYTIPAGVTLLIPFDAAGTMYLDEPEALTTYSKPTAYRTLTLASGANLVVNGSVNLSAKMSARQNYNGSATVAYGHLKMEEGSKLTVNNGGVLYAWGFITGTGNVEILSGGAVHESFHVTDWRGGSALTSILLKSGNDVFPFSQYYVQNIQTALTLYSGAKEYGYMAINVSGDVHGSSVDFIGGNGAMFNIASGYIVKDLKEDTGRTSIDVYGNVSIDPIVVKANMTSSYYESTIDSEDYILPINGNMDVNLWSGNATINQSMVLLPGAKMYIAAGTKCTLGSGKIVFLYDAADWTAESLRDAVMTSALYPCYVPAGSATVAGRDQDASVCVDGFIDASAGYVYTTTGGANVYSNGGGQILMKGTYLNSNGGYNHKLGYIKQTGTSVSYFSVDVTTAQLKNADGSSVKFDKSSGTINYIDGVWTCQHAYLPYEVAPNCVDQGYTIYTCPCGASYKENYVDALGHDPIAHDGKAATCTEDGWKAYETCSRCDYSSYETISATGHSYDEGVITTAPTCEAEGVKTFTCSCGDSYTEPVAATGHSYREVVTAPTCEDKGYTTYTCDCGHSYTGNEVAALGHSYDDGVITVQPGCETEGVKTFTCSCGDSYTEPVAATGHSYVDHDAKAPTCTENGWNAYKTCENCDYSDYSEIKATGHSYNTEVAEPTCTAPGYTTHTCACGDSYTDNEVVALGHSYDSGVVTVEPGCETEGVKTFTCACGDSYTESVAALGHDMVAQPGQAPTVDAIGWTAHEACSRCDHKVGYVELNYNDGLFVANGASYLDWADALATGDTTIELLNDVSVADLEIPVGITLDLNGKTLTAANVASFGDIIDTVGGGAVATQNLLTTNNSYLPLKDGGVYRFFTFELVSLGAKGNNAKVKFGFALNFADESAYALIAAGAELDVTMTLTWSEGSTEFAFGAELVKAYAQLHLANPGRQAAMILNVTGADTLASGSELSLIPAVLAVNGQISVVSDTITYTVA